MEPRDTDCLHRFVFESTDVRGELVRLDASWHALLERRVYPAPVRELLGQALAAAVLLSATIKIDGRLQLQLRGEGPVTMVLVEVTAQRTVRALARWAGEVPVAVLPSQVGPAWLTLAIDPGGAERYQGVVAVERETLAATLEHYFLQSEQLATRLWLAADRRRAAGMLLQRLPTAGADRDAWQREVLLAETVMPRELLELKSRQLLHRLFHEEDLRVFDPEPVSFRCTCSRQRSADMLRGLGRGEVRDILREQGRVIVTCEFCAHTYAFDAVDAERLFAAAGQPEIPGTRH